MYIRLLSRLLIVGLVSFHAGCGNSSSNFHTNRESEEEVFRRGIIREDTVNTN